MFHVVVLVFKMFANGLANKRAAFGTRICQPSTEFYYVL
jgi:hypothetical protein